MSSHLPITLPLTGCKSIQALSTKVSMLAGEQPGRQAHQRRRHAARTLRFLRQRASSCAAPRASFLGKLRSRRLRALLPLSELSPPVPVSPRACIAAAATMGTSARLVALIFEGGARLDDKGTKGLSAVLSAASCLLESYMGEGRGGEAGPCAPSQES